MCAVGEEIGMKRQVWSNDVQVFASEVAKALFVSRDNPLLPVSVADIHHGLFVDHFARLSADFRKPLDAEERMLDSEQFSQFQKRYETLTKVLASPSLAAKRRAGNLFASTYAGSYIGTSQALEADSIVAAIKRASRKGLITDDQKRWLTIGLGRALLRVATSTGHFAL
jgi:adenine-specific DNA-methyltransferase